MPFPQVRVALASLSLALAGGILSAAAPVADYPISPVPFTDVTLHDSFWLPRIHTNHTVTIPIAIKQCQDTGRVDNFLKAAHEMPGAFGTQFPFDDTDLYKILEGISYTIQVEPDPKLEKLADDWIALIARAQEPDGYLYTARTIDPKHPHPWSGPERWVSEADLSHELYNSGHLYEAAAAHFQATGKRTLLTIALRNADLLCETFGPGKRSVAPGHQIVEMGLVKLFRVTGEKRYLDLARFFLECRGTGRDYSQNHVPVTQQREAVGHAVRATYMYSGMADIAALEQDKAYHEALKAIWDDVVTRKLALTGGIGALAENEGFSGAYDLPNFSSYNETCAAIGNVYWNQRMFLLEGDARYVDVLERSLYNGVISGVSLAGDGFFYPNPLEARCNYERSAWFGCACCPSNICRFLPSVPGYAYAHQGDRIYVNLFVDSEARVALPAGRVTLVQKTAYPWSGDVEFSLKGAPASAVELALRVPAWARPSTADDLYQFEGGAENAVQVTVNGSPVTARSEKGYLLVKREWKEGDRLAVNFPMPARRVSTSKIPADAGRVAFQRGPIVYTWESPDNAGVPLFDVVVPKGAAVESAFDAKRLGGIGVLNVKALQLSRDESGKTVEKQITLQAIPYAVWANRGATDMAVWLPENANLVTLPPATLAAQSQLSGVKESVGIRAVKDFQRSTKLNDRTVAAYSAKPTDGPFWLQYAFPKATPVSSTRIYWQDTKPWGEVALPVSVRVLAKNSDGSWQKVAETPVAAKAAEKGTVPFDGVTELHWTPVNTTAVKIEADVSGSNAVGLYEWEVD